MKKIISISLIVAILAFTNTVSAQAYKTGIGVRLSSAQAMVNNSITLKHFLNEKSAIEALFSFGDPLSLGALYEIHKPFSTEGLQWFYGGGGYIGFVKTYNPNKNKNETDAIKLAFGDHARKLVVNSTKSMTGHLLGGAGGIESVFCALAVHHQTSPPTINIFEQDPECDLDYCANVARDMKIDVAVNNNFGFGGTNGTLVFRKV